MHNIFLSCQYLSFFIGIILIFSSAVKRICANVQFWDKLRFSVGVMFFKFIRKSTEKNPEGSKNFSVIKILRAITTTRLFYFYKNSLNLETISVICTTFSLQKWYPEYCRKIFGLPTNFTKRPKLKIDRHLFGVICFEAKFNGNSLNMHTVLLQNFSEFINHLFFLHIFCSPSHNFLNCPKLSKIFKIKGNIFTE